MAASTARAVGEAIDIGGIDIVKRKGGKANFATAADHAAQEAIIARLRDHDPAIPVLAEEGPPRKGRTPERLWVVDPIDGTLNFSRAIPFYCVSIGYVEHGRARAGAIHSPRTNETFVAYEGGGARLNDLVIGVSGLRRIAQAFAVTTPSRFALLNKHCARIRTLGAAALEIAYVAAGRFDLFVHGALSPWDIAASGIIAREAGAAVVSLTSGEDAAWDERQVIVGPPALVRDALRTMPDLVRPAARKRARAS
ncbi:MAG: inositol monophosphatase family protein [Candidatus Limnocylindria bacterium]